MNSRSEYLKTEISKHVLASSHRAYLRTYNLIRVKRLLIQTLMIFAFQYFTIINLTFSFPALPMYPPIGIAFVMFYLLGNNSMVGLLLAGGCGYFLKGFSIESTLLYLTADIAGGYLGAFLCRGVFSQDLKPFANLKEGFQFLKINAFAVCLLSSLIRVLAIILNQKEPIHFQVLVFNFIDLWLSDLNAVLVLSGFILSWIYVPFSREKINGYLMTTAILFVSSSLYLAVFLALKANYLLSFGLKLYTLVPFGLLLYIICLLHLSSWFSKGKK